MTARSIAFLLLLLVPGCGGMDMLIDGAAPEDAGAPGDGSVLGDSAAVDVDAGPIAPAPDSGLPPADGGSSADDSGEAASDASVLVADAWAPAPGLCGNGLLDLGEVCDPGMRYPDGGVYGRAYAVACPDCTRIVCVAPPGLTGGGPVNDVCIYFTDPSGTAHASLLLWAAAAERDAQFAVLRVALFADGTRTSVSGSVALQRFGGLTGTWNFIPASGAPFVATALPRWTGRFVAPPPADCAYLTLTPTDATLTQIPCTAGRPGSAENFVMVEPPPYAP